METILILLGSLNPLIHLILVCLGSLVVLGGTYVKVVPAWFLKFESRPIIQHIVKALIAFSPIQRKKL